jgi:hypothetical protein
MPCRGLPARLALACVALLALCGAPQRSAASTYGNWHECSAQAVYGGMYGAELLANLSSFKSGLLGHVWRTFDPEVPAPQVCDWCVCGCAYLSGGGAWCAASVAVCADTMRATAGRYEQAQHAAHSTPPCKLSLGTLCCARRPLFR